MVRLVAVSDDGRIEEASRYTALLEQGDARGRRMKVDSLSGDVDDDRVMDVISQSNRSELRIVADLRTVRSGPGAVSNVLEDPSGWLVWPVVHRLAIGIGAAA